MKINALLEVALVFFMAVATVMTKSKFSLNFEK